MRVLLWCARFWPGIGGEERYVERLALGLVQSGCSVEVVTNTIDGASAEEMFGAIRVSRLPFPASTHADIGAVRAVRQGLRQVVERLRPEVVNLHTSGPSLAHYELHRSALPAPTVLTCHGVFPPEADAARNLSTALHRSAAIIASSAATRASLIVLDPAAARTEVCLPPVAPTTVPVSAGAMAPVVVGFGRMVPEKGWETALRSLPEVTAAVAGARLVLVGDGPYRPALEALTRQLGLAGSVEFTGFVSDDELTALIDAAAVAIVPSLHEEGFGMVAIEASARSRPVVASARGGLTEAVVDGVTGLLVPAGDPAALAAALIRVLGDRELAVRLGEGGLHRSAEFAVAPFAAATLDVYRRALLR